MTSLLSDNTTNARQSNETQPSGGQSNASIQLLQRTSTAHIWVTIIMRLLKRTRNRSVSHSNGYIHTKMCYQFNNLYRGIQRNLINRISHIKLTAHKYTRRKHVARADHFLHYSIELSKQAQINDF